MAKETTDPMAGLNEAKSQWIKWGKVGDWVRGTLCDVREMDSQMPDRAGEKVKVYEFIVQAGQFHNFEKIGGETKVDAEPTVLEKGAIWTIGGKPAIDQYMRNVKIGQIFGMRFAEEKPNKNKAFSPTKVVKVLIGEMDPDYKGENAADAAYNAM